MRTTRINDPRVARPRPQAGAGGNRRRTNAKRWREAARAHSEVENMKRLHRAEYEES